MKPRTQTVLAVLIIVLLVANFLKASPPFSDDSSADALPHVVGITAITRTNSQQTVFQDVYRVWSDGTVEGTSINSNVIHWSNWYPVPN